LALDPASFLRPKQRRDARIACGSFVRRSYVVIFLITRGEAQRTAKKYYGVEALKRA
jgi:hypothetical protein